jgi:Na+/melibiose symporter-like transporter
MEYNSNLPALTPAVIALIVISIAAGLSLAWNRQARFRRFVIRAWIGAAVIIVGGAVVFWISTVMVEGPRRATIDRSLQQHQQDELRERMQKGGH